MEIANFILTIISTCAAVASAFAAVISIRTKKKIDNINNKLSGNRSTQITGDLSVKNNGSNEGIMVGVNTGDIRK